MTDDQRCRAQEHRLQVRYALKTGISCGTLYWRSRVEAPFRGRWQTWQIGLLCRLTRIQAPRAGAYCAIG